MRDGARASRQALIEEAGALAAKAMERDTPSQVKAIQARWQEQAKLLPLAQRDERSLWEKFRAACDAIFEARQSKRKEEDERKIESRRALEELCDKLEQLGQAAERDDQDVRRASRELQEQWKKQAAGLDSPVRELEARFAKAKTAVESMLSQRARSREAALWQTLAAKEHLCEQLDGLVLSGGGAGEALEQTEARWSALPALPPAWETKLIARRDAALHALADGAANGAYRGQIEQGAESRRERLLELELLLGLDSPAELHRQRLALQVKQLRARFKSAQPATGGEGAGERLLAWCAQPGVADAPDRGRCERIFARLEKTH
ncbi:MAG: DUF349 domain-containing protein [Betaproteobacteria bacterium]|nr:DUF349 domain-containing protein [Betaproteobacteria bacterium]